MNWNSRYQKGDTPWEKGSFAPPLIEIDERMGAGIWGRGLVLVPGCGFGHDARWIAKKGQAVKGLDVSQLAVVGACERTEGDNPEFELGDFFKPELATCSAIFEHTCFCAIDPLDRETYAVAAANWLEPGGHLVAVFFLNPDHEGGPPFGCTLEELDGLFEKDFALVDEWQPHASYPGREGREWVRVYRRKTS